MFGIWETLFGVGEVDARATGSVKLGTLSFVLNGEEYQIDPSTTNVSGETRLLDFIRKDAALTGTKYMCREGGCGACVVAATVKDPLTGKGETRAVHSCLVPVLSCHGWVINTVESLGNRKTGYHPIQQKLVHFSGTQCGWCSPGMVMNMFSLKKSKKSLTEQQIEDAFDGNICRCTGYRPIMDAFKSFAVDVSEDIQTKCVDIEDICVSCPVRKSFSSKAECKSQCTHHKSQEIDAPSGDEDNIEEWVEERRASVIPEVELNLQTSGDEWIKATSFASIFAALAKFAAQGKKCRVVAGNTGQGVFKHDGPYSAYVEINDVAELKKVQYHSTSVIVGAGMTLKNFIELLRNLAKKPGYEYAIGMRAHVKRVANTPVRNVGTIAGNLMMKHTHPSFPSDIFLLLESVGAVVHVACNALSVHSHTLLDFLKMNMTGKIIVAVEFPQRIGYTYRSFKVTKRYQNAHAYVNAGFLFKLDAEAKYKVLEKPNIVYGGISPIFCHATKTEEFLNGKELGTLKTLKDAAEILKSEISPDFIPPDASPAYRKNLTQNLLYKFVLGVLKKQVNPVLVSGGEEIPRNVTKGQQNFDYDKGSSPLYKPVAKLEAPAQVSGEAEYVNDIPAVPGELCGVFVISTQANATLGNVDASEALALPGVVAFVQAKDIPGTNNCMGNAARVEAEPIFVTDKISFAGQAIGLVVAKRPEIATKAASLVKIEYKDVKKPILTIQQAVQEARDNGTYNKIFDKPIRSAEGPVKNSKNTISGEFHISGQAHVQMETHNTICRPNERGFDLFAATQGMDVLQSTVAAALKVPVNNIDVQVRRLGGGYGSKLTRCMQTAAACAIASYVTRKSVRVVIDFETNMKMVGKRFPIQVNYKVGFDDNGKIDKLKVEVVCDTGAFQNEKTDIATLRKVQSCYEAVGWELVPGKVRTNTPPNTWTRAPGSPKGVAIIETIMEHIAYKLNKDPLQIRMVNLLKTGDALIMPAPYPKLIGPNIIPELLKELESSAEVSKRKAAVEKFNQENRWRKRGLALCSMRYPQAYRLRYGAFISIYHEDGTVAVSHGGIEMGQGINTKVAQVVAHILGVTLDMIEIKPSDTLIGANSSLSGGAMASELASYAALEAAKMLRERIDAVKTEKKLDKATWEELIAACYDANVDLRATYFETPDDGLKPYEIWGLNCVEAEIDCLTGDFKIIRSDIFQDAGKSLSPEVDIGQVEGAYIMGLGMWTKEFLTYDENTGQLLTKNTWEYKVPFPKCIPEDFRVSLLSNRPNPLGVLSSKATGEAPICLSVTNLLAIRNAIIAARKDGGRSSDWFNMDTPVTPERIVALCGTDSSQFLY